MARLIIHVVKIKWNDGSRQTFRYDTEEQARAAARYQFVENWSENKSAHYAGPRLNWRWPIDLLRGRQGSQAG